LDEIVVLEEAGEEEEEEEEDEEEGEEEEEEYDLKSYSSMAKMISAWRCFIVRKLM
jgi:hypothetical protein